MKKNLKLKLLKNSLKAMLVILIILIVFGISFNLNLKRGKTLNKQLSLVEKHNKINNTITAQGFDEDEANVILNPYHISPLTALICFETTSEVAPEITIVSKNNANNIHHTFKKGSSHYLPIYGLYADYLNEVILTVDEEEYTYKIQTEKLPQDLINQNPKTFIDQDHTEMLNNQLYFLTPATDGYTAAYDLDGEVRWYLTEDFVWDIDRLKNGNFLLSTEKLVNPPYYTTGLYEVNMLGQIKNEYNLPGGYHHDFYEKKDGNLIIATNDFSKNTVEDVIVEIDRESGKIVKEIDLKNILKQHESKSANWLEFDWFHNNSVFLNENTNELILSGRHQDSIVSIDYDDLKINYILGDPSNASESYKQYFLKPVGELEYSYAQHSAIMISDQEIFVFDNGNNRSKLKDNYVDAKDNYSRGVVYEIDKDKKEVKQTFEYGKDRGFEYYSSYISNVNFLEDQHYLIHSGGVAYKDDKVLNNPPGIDEADKLISFTTEVLNGEKIFELSLDSNNYRANKLPTYPEGNYFNKEESNLLGEFEKTPVDKESLTILLESKNADQIFDKYNIQLKHEANRLSFAGNFKPSDKVSIILYSNFFAKKYDVVVSEKPYTAMCLDIFNDEEISVSKYINDKDLQNKYAIYLKINDELYKTNKLVDFK